eukprot:GFYU01005171.1.p1 GENE.GFYU01005171.1~~GFYU01005171.1.p1  ORF type:complete len:305 (-),score=66.74 GFYU01005171.1:270-1184(-)
MSTQPARLSASLILLCKSKAPCAFGFDYRVLMLKRSFGSSFAGGAYVFPGGVVDPSDSDAKWCTHLGISPARKLVEKESLKVAAAREAFEEAGVLMGYTGVKDSEAEAPALKRLRTLVHDDGSEFFGVFNKYGGSLSELSTWSRFVTPMGLEKKRFDTTFFIKSIQDAPDDLDADSKETIAQEWVSPGEFLGQFDQGRMKVLPPQWLMFKELEAMKTMEEVRAHGILKEANKDNMIPIRPFPVAGENCMILTMPYDESHDEYPGPTGGRNRLVISRTEDGKPSFTLEKSGVDLGRTGTMIMSKQ